MTYIAPPRRVFCTVQELPFTSSFRIPMLISIFKRSAITRNSGQSIAAYNFNGELMYFDKNTKVEMVIH